MKRPLSLRFRLLAGLGAVVLLAGGFIVYKIANPGAPSFRRGGAFGGAPSVEREAAPAISPSSDTTVPAAPAETATSATTPTTTASTAAPVPTQPRVTTTRRATSSATAPGTAQPAPPPTGGGPAPAPPPPPVAAGPRLPGTGTYTYAVDGEERASFFGSRRFPAQMTTVVHGASGLMPDQLVFDVRYSDQHEQRQVVGFRDDGIYWDYEAGSVTFGPRTETSEADYEPPMLQVPRPLEVGVTRTGTSQAKDARGSVVRTEDWKVSVVGREQVSVAGGAVDAWKVQVERKSRPGSSETVARSRTYWYDPGRAIWVKYTETLHAERGQAGFNFTYDYQVTATLVSFSPG
jgi:hypothetical protein